MGSPPINPHIIMPIILKTEFFEKKIIGQTKEYHIGPFKWSRDLFKKTFNTNQALFNKFDYFYLLNSNLGEASLFFKFFYDELERRNAEEGKRTLIVTSKPSHFDIAQAFDIRDIVCISGFSVGSYETSFTYKEKEFFVVFNNEYYDRVENSIRLSNTHFFFEMSKKLNVKPTTLKKRRISIPTAIAERSRIKAEKLGLDVTNFVMIIPHANSCQDLDKQLLQVLVRGFVEKGLHVFINTWESYPVKHPLIHTSYSFSLQELFVLAQSAHEIVAVRCGLVDFLSDARPPMTVIYSTFKNRPNEFTITEENVLSGFSLRGISTEYNFIREITLSEFHDEILNCKLPMG